MRMRVVILQCLIFTVEWALMLLGLGLIVAFVVPFTLIPESSLINRYFDAAVQAFIGLLLSLLWLYIWDRQVRIFFFRRSPIGTSRVA